MTQTIVRGVTVSDADILEAMQKFDRDRRNSFPEGRWKTYAVRHDGKLYPPKQIMRLATDLKDVGSGGKPINSRFEDLGFEVVYYDPGDPEIPSDDTLDTDDEVSISLESDIEAALAANIEQLEPGLHLFKENGLTGRQVQAKPAGRIDLLAKDANNRFVVIEIKAVEADRDVCG
jgi:hypothetical protein